MYATDRKTIVDRREMLRVKVKSLAEEARMIRREEQRSHGQIRDELRNHRVMPLRTESRAAGLAYGFIRGRTLEQMEAKSEAPPDWDRVRKLLKKYGPADILDAGHLKLAA
jgi:hypothetical protein